jgi:hypothetical protein
MLVRVKLYDLWADFIAAELTAPPDDKGIGRTLAKSGCVGPSQSFQGGSGVTIFTLRVVSRLQPCRAGLLQAQEYRPSILRPGFENVGAGQLRSRKRKIETDRDSFTPAHHHGGSASSHRRIGLHVHRQPRRPRDRIAFPNWSFDMASANEIELRFGTNYEVGGAGNPVSAVVPVRLLTAMPDIEDEAKRLVWTQSGTHQTARMGAAKARCSCKHSRRLRVKRRRRNFVVTYVFGWELQNGWTWDSAIRYSTGSEEEDHFQRLVAFDRPSRSRSANAGKAHAEYFGIFSDGRDSESVQHYFSPGAHYLITRDWGSRRARGLGTE